MEIDRKNDLDCVMNDTHCDTNDSHRDMNNPERDKNKLNINLHGRHACTGCGVCSAVCPSGAVSMFFNEEGFLEAAADNGKCTACGLCRKVCGKYDENEGVKFKEILKSLTGIYGGASNNDEIRIGSSSGGIGHEIARLCIEEGYIAAGAAYDEKSGTVKHVFAENPEELEALKGSKYLQSHTTEAFSAFRKDRKYVVFGTPCQIFTLRKFIDLKGISGNFLLVDFFCHGIPSRHLWDKYLSHLKAGYNQGDIKAVNFRDKKTGWHTYSMSITGEKGSYGKNMEDDLFYIFFLSDVCLNKPCYSCRFRGGSMGSDIRLGDFWGPKYKSDRKGVSVVLVNTEKGNEVIKKLSGRVGLEEATIEELLSAQPQVHAAVPGNRDEIIKMLSSNEPLGKIYRKTLMKKHLKYKLKSTLKRLVPAEVRTALKKLK